MAFVAFTALTIAVVSLVREYQTRETVISIEKAITPCQKNPEGEACQFIFVRAIKAFNRDTSCLLAQKLVRVIKVGKVSCRDDPRFKDMEEDDDSGKRDNRLGRRDRNGELGDARGVGTVPPPTAGGSPSPAPPPFFGPPRSSPPSPKPPSPKPPPPSPRPPNQPGPLDSLQDAVDEAGKTLCSQGVCVLP